MFFTEDLVFGSGVSQKEEMEAKPEAFFAELQPTSTDEMCCYSFF